MSSKVLDGHSNQVHPGFLFHSKIKIKTSGNNVGRFSDSMSPFLKLCRSDYAGSYIEKACKSSVACDENKCDLTCKIVLFSF